MTIRFLRERYEPKIPIIGVEPAIKPAVEFVNSNNKKDIYYYWLHRLQ